MAKTHWLMAGATLALALPLGTSALHAEGAVALSGKVASDKEGAMEGVVVSAKKEGSTITVSVTSDAQGHYSFPADHLSPGHYALKIRAVGYDLDGPQVADVPQQGAATADLKLKPTRNIVPQLSNAEWMLSVPGTDDQKTSLLNCTSCHTLERIVRSTHDADEFTQVIWRMTGYSFVSQPIKPQRRMDPNFAGEPERYRKQAEYLATINLSAVSQWEYPLKTLPRPTGRSTRAIITEYDLPRPTIEPHDVITDQNGMVWFSNFGEQTFDRLDPKTGEVSEFPIPELKPGYPVGMLDLEEDKDGGFWLGMMHQAALAKFDPKTGKVQLYPVPADMNDTRAQLTMVGMQHPADGHIWTNNAGTQDILRVDLKSGQYETFHPLKELPGKGPYTIYGIAPDSHNNIYFSEFLTNYIGRIDAETGKVSWFPTPTLHSRPRRMEMDGQDQLWFAEYRGNQVGMFDTKTEKFAEWQLPPQTYPYYVTFDKHGEIWSGGMTSDRVVRLDPKTGKTVAYLLPRETNIRRVFVDNSTNPVTFWTGSNHGASVVKVEPLD